MGYSHLETMKHKFVSTMCHPYFRPGETTAHTHKPQKRQQSEALVAAAAKAVTEAMTVAMVKALAMTMTEAIAESGC